MGRIDHLNDPEAPKANSIVVAATVHVTDAQGRVLLIHRTDNDLWALPGGALELGEYLAETAVRETREETGLTVEVTDIVGLYTNPHHVVEFDNGEVRQQFSICFRARPIGGTLTPSDESSEVCWVDPSDLDGMNIHPSIRLRITHGLENRTTPYIG